MNADDITGLVLVQSAGERLADRFAQQVAIDIKIEVSPISGNENAARFAAHVTVRDRDNDVDQYSGTAAFIIMISPDIDRTPPEVLPYVWPHLRAELMAQCGRIAQQPLMLPAEIPSETLRRNVPA